MKTGAGLKRNAATMLRGSSSVPTLPGLLDHRGSGRVQKRSKEQSPHLLRAQERLDVGVSPLYSRAIDSSLNVSPTAARESRHGSRVGLPELLNFDDARTTYSSRAQKIADESWGNVVKSLATKRQLQAVREPSSQADDKRSQRLWQKASASVKVDQKSRKPSLREQAQAHGGWVSVPPRIGAAADSFDRVYYQRVAVAEKIHFTASKPRDALYTPTVTALEQALFDVTTTRFIAPERFAEKKTTDSYKRMNHWDKTSKSKQAFDLYQSIWAPRKAWSDSKDLYDTDEAELQRFTIDWSRCIDLGVARLIMRHDGHDKADENGDGLPDEVVETGTVLWQNSSMLNMLFAYYACLGNDPHSIDGNRWALFVDDYKLASRSSQYCKRADMDRIFIVVDAVSARLEAAREKRVAEARAGHGGHLVGKYVATSDEKQKALNRPEFFTAIVHICINKYVLPGEIPDVSDALAMMLEVDIQAHVNAKTFAEPNDFRMAFAYTEDVTWMLTVHKESLSNLFKGLSGSEGKAGKHKEEELLSLDEWTAFLRGLDLIGIDLTEREVTRAFAWSRMIVIDPRTRAGHMKESNVPFEGFLECMCRLALLKALPTDAEIESSGCANAGEFLQELLDEDPYSHALFLEQNCTQWGEVARQPPERCVAHFLEVVFFRIEVQTCGKGRGDDDDVLSAKTIQTWCRSIQQPLLMA